MHPAADPSPAPQKASTSRNAGHSTGDLDEWEAHLSAPDRPWDIRFGALTAAPDVAAPVRGGH